MLVAPQISIILNLQISRWDRGRDLPIKKKLGCSIEKILILIKITYIFVDQSLLIGL